tara:strand:- start:212 stop:877 length:666 start_codon:yes stop_codon:yes gene_type:complete
MNKLIKCLIIDLDGTLLHSGPDLIDSLNFTLKRHNLNIISDNVIGSLVGGGARAMIEKAFIYLRKNSKDYNIELMINDFIEFYYDNCSNKSIIYPTVIKSLRILKQKFKICICTNKRQNLTEKIINEFGIEKYFDFVLGSSENLKLKPDTEMLNHILEKLTFDPSQCLMIGDSSNDIIPANKLGMKSIFVEYGYGQLTLNSIPNYKIDKFIKITQILKVKF